MFWKISIVALILVRSMISFALAQTPERVAQSGHWGTYSYFYESKGEVVCYVLSVPIRSLPVEVKHGDNFFLVSKYADGRVTFEPQFMAGYDLLENSEVQVAIGDKSFSLFTRGASAWVENAQDERRLVTAMKAGNTMTVKAVSHRGTGTTYVYSLKGFISALKSAETCK